MVILFAYIGCKKPLELTNIKSHIIKYKEVLRNSLTGKRHPALCMSCVILRTVCYKTIAEIRILDIIIEFKHYIACKKAVMTKELLLVVGGPVAIQILLYISCRMLVCGLIEDSFLLACKDHHNCIYDLGFTGLIGS